MIRGIDTATRESRARRLGRLTSCVPVLVSILVLGGCASVAPPLAIQKTVLVSTNAEGGKGDKGSRNPVFSPDGKRIAFISESTNLVPEDTNGTVDLFLKDLNTGAIMQINTDANGHQATGEEYSIQSPVFSRDGTKVAFFSMASNLVPGDTNGLGDIFVKDLRTGGITRVNTDAAGHEASDCNGRFAGMKPAFSPDGTEVAFTSGCTNLVPGHYAESGARSDIFVKNLRTGAITWLLAPAPTVKAVGASYDPLFSPDGKQVVFCSWSTHLGVGESHHLAIFMKDRVRGTVTLISADATGNQGNPSGSFNPAFSPDGTKVAFQSNSVSLDPAPNHHLIDIFVKNLKTNALNRISGDVKHSSGAKGGFGDPVFAPDGVHIAFDGDGIFIKNLATGKLTKISGHGSHPVFSPDGTRIAYEDGHIFVATLNARLEQSLRGYTPTVNSIP